MISGDDIARLLPPRVRCPLQGPLAGTCPLSCSLLTIGKLAPLLDDRGRLTFHRSVREWKPVNGGDVERLWRTG